MAIKENNPREKISAFMDGDIHESDDPAQVISELSEKDNLETWAQYHYIGEVLRNGDAVAPLNLNLTRRILTELEKEPPLNLASPAVNEETYPFAYRAWAMAAAITFAFVVGWMLSSFVGQQKPEQHISSVPETNDADGIIPPQDTMLVSNETNQRVLPAQFIAEDNQRVPASLIPLDFLVTHEEFSPSVRLWTGTNAFQRFNNWGVKVTDDE